MIEAKPSFHKYQNELEVAQVLSVHVCGDDHIHVIMEDALGNLLGEMSFDPEEALAVAKRIEAAADHALGIA